MVLIRYLMRTLAESVGSPNVMPVRFAKVVRRPDRHTYEYTNASMWRKARYGYSNPNRNSPLTNLPDYSYLDGRPAPLGSNLKARMETQKKYAERITLLSAEIDFARERHQQKLSQENEYKQHVIGNKLKKKGASLLHQENLKRIKSS